MLREYRHRSGLRRWIAAAAAFTLALHVLLSPLAGSKLIPWQADRTGNSFVICHGAGGSSGGGEEQPVPQPKGDSHCILCSLVSSCAVLPSAIIAASFDLGELSQLLVPLRSQVTEHRSPTGEYQRGPPTHSVTS